MEGVELLKVTQVLPGNVEEAWSCCRRRRKGRKNNAWTFLSENATFQFYVLNSARETFEEIQAFESFNNIT